MDKLLLHNAIPYILIVLMGYFLYLEWDAKREAQKERDSAWATMGIIQNRNEQRFNELNGIKGAWHEGKFNRSL